MMKDDIEKAVESLDYKINALKREIIRLMKESEERELTIDEELYLEDITKQIRKFKKVKGALR